MDDAVSALVQALRTRACVTNRAHHQLVQLTWRARLVLSAVRSAASAAVSLARYEQLDLQRNINMAWRSTCCRRLCSCELKGETNARGTSQNMPVQYVR